MSPYLRLLFMAALVVAQTTVMAAAGLGSTKPFLPLLAVVSWTLLAGALGGAWWALAIGLMLDAVSPSPHLFYTLPLLLVTVVVAVGRARLFPANVVIPSLLAALGTAVFLLAQHALVALAGGVVRWSGDWLGRALVPEVVLNLLWLPVVYFPLRAVSRRTRAPRMEWER